jgi:hypothetical protein
VLKPLDPNSFTRRDSGIWGLIALGCYLLTRLALHLLRRDEISQFSGLFLATTVFAVRVRWDLRRESWFWVSVVALAVVQAAIAISVPWPQWDRSIILLFAPVVFGDFLFLFFVFVLLEMLFSRARAD